MQVLEHVQGTQDVVPLIEIGVTTVYVRENVTQQTDDEGNQYWDYKEIQYTLPEYLELLTSIQQSDKAETDNAIAELSIVIGELMNV